MTTRQVTDGQGRSWTERRTVLPSPDPAATMTRAAIADAVQEGRMSPAEAAEADPSLAHLLELCGISPAEANERFILDALGVDDNRTYCGDTVDDDAPEAERPWVYDDGPGLP